MTRNAINCVTAFWRAIIVKKPISTIARAMASESRVNRCPNGMIGWVMKNAIITSAPQMSKLAGTLTFITSSRVTFNRSITPFNTRGITITLTTTVRAAA